MKVLLDASFLRHLQQINQIAILSTFVTSLKWEFILPGIVYNELKVKGIPNELKTLLSSGTIPIKSCSNADFTLMKAKLLGLDDGELDAICIVNKCKDRKFKNYLILTDDIPAQTKAGRLGMSSLDILMFLFLSNQSGFISRKLAQDLMNILENSGYYINPVVKTDYLKRLT